MPSKPLRPCAAAGCPGLTAQRYCEEHAATEPRRHERERGTRTQRGYGNDWLRLSRWKLTMQPLCEYCLKEERYTAATEVDHIDGNNRNNRRDNLASTCRPCHNRKTHGELPPAIKQG